MGWRWLTWVIMLVLFSGSVAAKRERQVLSVGYFPNITHAPAVIGNAGSYFQEQMGKQVEIKTYLFNAGPSAMEALLAGQLDLVYVGPNPAVNCYIRSNGKALKVVAGCCSGGAALVRRGDVRLTDPGDLRQKRIATPQLGNTQDVALRTYLQQHGLNSVEHGGDVRILPTGNNNLLILFQRNEIDGAWTVEPWVSRLVVEGKGRVFLDERKLWPNRQFTTAIVVASSRLLRERPQLVKKWVRAHVALTRKIQREPDWAMQEINKELQRINGKPLPEKVMNMAWKRLEITYDPLGTTMSRSAQQAYSLGFLGNRRPNLLGLTDLTILNEVLREQGLPKVK